MKRKVNRFEVDDVQPGKYKARFDGCQGPFPGPNGEIIIWEFQVEDDEGPKQVSGISSISFSHDSRCKGFRWARAIDPNLTLDSEDWEDEDAVGNIVRVTVVYFDKNGELTPTVKEVFPWQEKTPVTS